MGELGGNTLNVNITTTSIDVFRIKQIANTIVYQTKYQTYLLK